MVPQSEQILDVGVNRFITTRCLPNLLVSHILIQELGLFLGWIDSIVLSDENILYHL
jgi:hypothetical protein